VRIAESRVSGSGVKHPQTRTAQSLRAFLASKQRSPAKKPRPPIGAFAGVALGWLAIAGDRSITARFIWQS